MEAPTIAELADKIGIAPRVLTHTVEEFNAAVQDDLPFDPTKQDGKATRVGFKILPDGRKVRFAKRSGVEIDG